jgi:hypothetical protein
MLARLVCMCHHYLIERKLNVMSQTQSAVFAGTIAETFVLSGMSGKGVIVVPAEAWAVSLRVRDWLRLVKPNGEVLLVKIGGIEMTNPPSFSDKCGIMLTADNLTKDDVPVGSTLWLVQTQPNG